MRYKITKFPKEMKSHHSSYSLINFLLNFPRRQINTATPPPPPTDILSSIDLRASPQVKELVDVNSGSGWQSDSVGQKYVIIIGFNLSGKETESV